MQAYTRIEKRHTVDAAIERGMLRAIISGTMWTNQLRNKIGRLPSASCSCGHACEDRRHLLWGCNLYADIRADYPNLLARYPNLPACTLERGIAVENLDINCMDLHNMYLAIYKRRFAKPARG